MTAKDEITQPGTIMSMYVDYYNNSKRGTILIHTRIYMPGIVRVGISLEGISLN